jgi:hypothetical protein
VARRAAAVSRFFARIGSPCLRHGVHGASIAAATQRAEAAAAVVGAEEAAAEQSELRVSAHGEAGRRVLPCVCGGLV